MPAGLRRNRNWDAVKVASFLQNIEKMLKDESEECVFLLARVDCAKICNASSENTNKAQKSEAEYLTTRLSEMEGGKDYLNDTTENQCKMAFNYLLAFTEDR